MPAAQEGRERLVGLLPEVVQVGALGQRGRVDFHDRPHHHDLPRGLGVGDGGEQRRVHPLVHDAEEAEARAGRQVRLHARLVRVGREGAGEVRCVYARREAEEVRVPVLAPRVEAVASGEHDIGASERAGLGLHEFGRGVGEERQLVHRVEHEHVGAEVLGERKRQGRVEPRVVAAQVVRGGELVQQRAQGLGLRAAKAVARRGRVRPRHLDARRRTAERPEGGAVGGDRLLDEQDRAGARHAREQVLGALVDEVPAQVGEDDERSGGRRSRHKRNVGVRRTSVSAPGRSPEAHMF